MNPDKNEDFSVDVGSALQKIRKRKGISISQANLETGISEASIRNWERGVNTPNLQALVALMSCYNCSFDEIMGTAPPDVTENDEYLILASKIHALPRSSKKFIEDAIDHEIEHYILKKTQN